MSKESLCRRHVCSPLTQVCANWVTHRLLPAARAIWPAPMKLYVYMDNYSGHTGRDASKFWPRKGTGHTRQWNLEALQREGCEGLLHNGTVFSISSLLAKNAPKAAGAPKPQKRVGPKPPNLEQIIALGREWMWAHKPNNALSAVEAAALADGNCQIIFCVPMTPDANPIEHWWGTGKGFLGRRYDGDVSCETTTRRWRDIAIERKMTMSSGGAGKMQLQYNPVCQSYVDSGISYAQSKLVPVSALATCGDLGSFDLSKAEGAVALRAQLDGDERMFYRLWRECEGLSLVPPGDAGLPVEDEEDTEE